MAGQVSQNDKQSVIGRGCGRSHYVWCNASRPGGIRDRICPFNADPDGTGCFCADSTTSRSSSYSECSSSGVSPYCKAGSYSQKGTGDRSNHATAWIASSIRSSRGPESV